MADTLDRPSRPAAQAQQKSHLASIPARFSLHPVRPQVLAVRTIASVAEPLAEALGLPAGRRSVGFITCTSDDALYVALDEGTKAA